MAVTLITFGAAEAALRIQDALGPIYDLSMHSVSADGLSEILNHRPLPINKIELQDKAIFGDQAGMSYVTRFTSQGVRINQRRHAALSTESSMNILVLGDSFMQGYDDRNTVPQRIWEHLVSAGLRVRIDNAAQASYSTLIYIIQAKMLIPKLRPDFILFDIDETDMGDDYIRYKSLVVRDSSGHAIAVRTSPINKEFISGLTDIRDEPLYLIRLARKLYHTRFYIPRLIARNPDGDVLSFLLETGNESEERFKAEIDYFEQNVDELLKTLIGLMIEKRRLLVVYHPHLRHLVPDNGGRVWNNFVSSTVAKVCEANGVSFFDASFELRRRFGGNPENYYWPGDLHFNFDGIRLYGDVIAERLHSQLQEGGLLPDNKIKLTR